MLVIRGRVYRGPAERACVLNQLFRCYSSLKAEEEMSNGKAERSAGACVVGGEE